MWVRKTAALPSAKHSTTARFQSGFIPSPSGPEGWKGQEVQDFHLRYRSAQDLNFPFSPRPRPSGPLALGGFDQGPLYITKDGYFTNDDFIRRLVQEGDFHLKKASIIFDHILDANVRMDYELIPWELKDSDGEFSPPIARKRLNRGADFCLF